MRVSGFSPYIQLSRQRYYRHTHRKHVFPDYAVEGYPYGSVAVRTRKHPENICPGGFSEADPQEKNPHFGSQTKIGCLLRLAGKHYLFSAGEGGGHDRASELHVSLPEYLVCGAAVGIMQPPDKPVRRTGVRFRHNQH